MFTLDSVRATTYAIIIFVTTTILGYLFPGHAIITSGLLMAIFLTIFIRHAYSTIVAGALGIALAITYPLIHQYQTGNMIKTTENLFVIILLFSATLLAWYIKSLLVHLQFDRTHMTSLFENATEGIVLTNGEGTIVLANPSAEQIFGYDSHELIGKPIEVLIPRKFSSHHTALRKDFYRNPSNRTMGSGRDLYAVRKNGTEFPVEVSLSHYRQDQEQYVIAFIVDITTRKDTEKSIQQKQKELEIITQQVQLLNTQLEAKVEERTSILKDALEKLEQSQEELNEALKKEKQLNELKSRFVSMASHEFRTPLSTILSSATLVSKYPLTEEEEKRDKHLLRIKDAVNHMNELLEDFLSLGKLEENKVGFLPAVFAPKNFMEEIIDEMRVQAKEGQQIIFDYQGEDSFLTDKRVLKVTLLNLLSNAIKFSAQDQAIRMQVLNENHKLHIAIKDRGIGIPEEDIPYLFDTFFRSRNASNIQGTGLGLPIIKRYLQLLDGTIQIESVVEEGTEVLVTIPWYE